MGRKEKIVNATVTPSSPPQTSIISKRTYTRQISNKSSNSAESSSNSTQQQLSDSVSSDMDGFVNDVENSVQCKEVTNGRTGANAKAKRKTSVGKQNIADAVDVHSTVIPTPTPATTLPHTHNTFSSSIAQRPRRQVKHKFIKSANINLIEQPPPPPETTVQSNDVNEPPSNSLTLLNSLSPNNKVRLVPLVHRLPVNTTKLKWQNVIHPTDAVDTIEAVDETTELQSDDMISNVDNEPATTVIKEMKTERHKKLSNSKQAIRRGRQLRQTVCPVEPIESDNAHDVCTEETEDTVHESTVADSGLTNEFEEDEDDIMIVEEKDALDVPDSIEFEMADEIIIEETITDDDEFAQVICVTPNKFNPNSIVEHTENNCRPDDRDDSITSIEAHESSESQQTSNVAESIECDNQTEPIYLSDSLSCFDSDSDREDSKVEITARNNLTEMTEVKHEHVNNEIDRLNESTDDVIIVQECIEPIEVEDPSDSEDERFANKFSFETFVDSDSQPTIDSSKAEDTEDSSYKQSYDNARLDETTTDADDDSSEVDKRSMRSRRDNVGRKNYSIRRTYARRKLKNDSEVQHNQSKTEDGSSNDLIENTPNTSCADDRLNSENDIKLKAVLDSNTTDGTVTDEENLSLIKAKPIRTYVRKKASISKLVSCDNDIAEASKENEKVESDSHSENATSSGNDVEVIPVINEVEVNHAPRKRGRPRKKQPILIRANRNEPSEINETSKDELCVETQTNVTEIQKADINETQENDQQIIIQEFELEASSVDNLETSSNQLVQDETIANDIPHVDSMANNSITEITVDAAATTNEKDSNNVQPIEIDDEIMMEVEATVENSIDDGEQFELDKADCTAIVDGMEVDCIESEHTIAEQITNHTEIIAPVKEEPKSISEQISESPTIHASVINEESSRAQSIDDEALKNVSKNKEKIDSTAAEILTHRKSEEKSSENQKQIDTEMLTEDVLMTDSTVSAKSSTQDIKEEPAVEAISVKIEQIAIDTEPKVNSSPSKPLQSVTESHLNDTKPDVKQPKIKTEEKPIQPKLDKGKTPMDADVPSALAGLPKEVIEQIEDTSIRRSGRIRTINKTKQRSQGLGLVKDKKRAPVIVDEDSSSAGFEASENIQDKDALQSGTEAKVRVKTEEELEKEKVDRENGMKLFVPIIDNEYRSERTISKEAKKMTCDCFLTQLEHERGEMGCGDDCLNRMLLIECGPKCIVGDRCTNRRFQKHENSSCNIFKTEKKGYGLVATGFIPAGQFIMEYVGEVLNSKQFEKRASDYSKQMNAHYYFMALSSDCVIDATKKGNISRFINHSCDPNAETQKWTVNGELRIGFFSKKPILADEEITFDYQFQRYGKEAQKCFCESINCRGWIGGEPESDEELESEDDDEGEDDISVSKDDGELSESIAAATADGTGKKKGKITKPKKPKDATKKPPRKERAKANRKTTAEFKKHKRNEIMEDPDLDKEIDVLASGGLKNQAQTLQLSRLFVRAKLQKAKLHLLSLLRDGELPCRRLFLDYHGLQLMHSWMSDVNSADRMLSLKFRLEILQTLEKLPITNKTTLQDSKVLSTVQRWSTVNEYSFLLNDSLNENANSNKKTANATADESSPSDSGSGTPISNDETAIVKVDEALSTTTSNAPSNETPSSEPSKESKSAEITCTTNTNSSGVKTSDVLDAIPQILEQNSTLKGMGVDLLKSIISTSEKNTQIIEDSEKLPDGEMGKLVRDIRLLASKLVRTWEQLPESYKIPKKSRIEQMKQHEREANESCKENVEEKITPKQQPFSSSGRFSERSSKASDLVDPREKDPREKDPRDKDSRYRRSFNSSTLSKHQRRQMFEAKVAQEDAERKKVMENMIHESRCAFFHLDPRLTRDFMVPFCVNPSTGQWYGDKMNKVPTPPSHAHIKPPPVPLPTDINEYTMPAIDLPDLWKYAINEKGQIYYYHTKILIPQWEPPIKLLPLMEEHRINDIDLKVEAIETQLRSADDDHEMEHDCDDEDEDVVSILSNSTMNANCLLELKSDPILEKYNDDDSSSTDSDDSLVNELAELEAKYSYIKKKTDDYWMNMKRPPNLNEEIAAMAKSDLTSMHTIIMENARARDEEKQTNATPKPSANDLKRKRKKNRAQLVQTIRISPLSEEMKRELRRDSRRYKENKAKLRRQKEMLLKRKIETKSSHPDAPVRKLKKITEGLPQVPKHIADGDAHMPIDNHSFSVSSFSSSRFNSEALDSKRAKPSSAFASISATGLSTASSLSLNSSLSSLDTSSRSMQSTRNNLPSTSLTQSIVNKLPSIGHKFAGDTEELIMKNTIKPIKPAEPVILSPATVPVVNTIRSTPIQPIAPQQQQQQTTAQQQLVKKPPHPILNPAKSSPKPMMKKKKTSDPNECIDVNSPAAKKIKEKFKSDISGDIVRHLKPYLSKTCTVGQIQSSDDFRHLARKLTFFVMLKELKYCNNVSLLEVTDSVKNKAREYIKKYMSKFGKVYIRDENEKDYHFEDL